MPGKKEVWCTVNGKKTRLLAAGNTTLLQALRDIGVTSVKRGCEEGECGACTVILDGLPQKSCIVLAQEVEGATILTSEGLVQNGTLHPIQQAFIDEGAIQCGFCTPGMVLSTWALLQSNPNPTDEQIKQALSGNLCRCTGYAGIQRAVKKSAKLLAPKLQGGDSQ
ncbi:MAG TPA: (2Fe-2S)-binding protein [Thermotogota bacterium]|nr:(2Fe-2S)-binding protein [Thermotogota bacterium]HRW93120.1 (2Fe-2S)-binding protein [Thermotogota bacterium]